MAIDGRDDLRGLCEKLEISADVMAGLEAQVGYLRTFKNEILPNSQTPAQRTKSMQRIEALVIDLKKAVEGLPMEDRWDLDNQFLVVSKPPFELTYETVEEATFFDIGGSLLPGIGNAAAIVRGRLGSVKSTGRPPVTARQADFVRCIAQVLKRANVVPSHSGSFVKLCTAVFKEAGLTLPDKAIRFFMKDVRPKMKAAGYCL